MAHTEAHSYVRGTVDSPLSDLTISALLAETAARVPNGLAVVFREQGVRWNWEEFANEIEAFAAGLQELGLRKGDRVGIWSPNRVEWLVTQFATARLGLVLVNINPAYRLSELEYALGVSGCRAVVSAQEFKSSKYLDMLQTVRPQLPGLEWIIRMGESRTPNMLNYVDILATGRRVKTCEEPLDCHDPINIQFTSGTTGSPKGATLTHHNVVNNARFIAQALNFSETDRLCIPVPLYHCFGMVLAVLACVSTGATMVFPGEAFDPAAVLAAVSEERCTALHGVPTMFIAELAHPDFKTFDLSSLRTGIMAGSPCPIETMRQVVSEMNMSEVTIAYGMTETSPVSFQSSTTDPLERRVATVGRIQPWLEAKVIDRNGQLVLRGETGELCVRGYSVMRGYWDDPARTGEVIKDGWMHSGDLAVIDDEGYCNIVGRAKDMLIRGGENVYPREIEEFLFRHPKVQSAQVFGVPDQKYGEEICAWIVLKPGQDCSENDIREFCRNQIAHYKVPRYIRFVAEMPMTVTGKAQKFVMRELMVKELNLTETRTA
ncbi:AMP-binding protein [Bradyrhizobium sp. CCBAU 53351]|uniref:AMP-binding protein n=1 Tax=Bradyrhizobium sp. CCBAU 53351 TaxID=1325114 RepID=UPI0018892EF2|nr:AMP-binding protein [Bradyrhizobium sp. CCBAU 53351]QOZ77926.1 AMP-binding protein [Bradyrhizobium sp. CCBAU 53351]